MTVICDWLDVTYSPVNAPEREVLDVIQSVGGYCLSSKEESISGSSSVWRVGPGVIRFDRYSRYHRFSASGAALEFLRGSGAFMLYLSALSDAPHTVTRLDAALDIHADAAPVIARLRRRYPRECYLSNKPVRTKTILESRGDGRESGTWYAGHRSRARVTARVYDKQLEVFARQQVEIPPLTRYELTFKRDTGVTLRDAAEPERVFWHYASPALLKRPPGVPEWSSGWGIGWHYERPEIALAGVLKRRIESSGDLAAILAIADRAGCMEWCCKLLVRMVQDYEREHAQHCRHQEAS